MLTTKPNSTRDAHGAHIEPGMYVIHRTCDIRARVHGITDYGDVVINYVTGGLPITTRGVHLEVDANIKCAHCKSYHQSIAEVRACGSTDNAAKIFADIDAAPLPLAQTVSPQKVPAGRYAIAHDGVLKFYHVDTPTEGKWAGRTFVKQQVSDDLHPVYGKAGRTILALIAADPRQAMIRYGKEIGRCGHCGRTLTNAESRADGIGPVCRVKFNFMF